MDSMDVEQMNKIRAQYRAHVRMTSTIGGYDLIDIYCVLYVLSRLINGGHCTQTPFPWLTKDYGFDPNNTDQIVDALSDLLVVERLSGSGAERIVKGLTQDGIEFLKKHVKELADDLPAFSLTEQAVMDIELSKEEPK